MYMVIDPVQLVLLIVILVLTGLLVVLGIQVFFILKELRQTIIRTNRVLDNAQSITANIDAPIAAVSSLVVGAKASSLLTVAKLVSNFLGRKKDQERKAKD